MKKIILFSILMTISSNMFAQTKLDVEKYVDEFFNSLYFNDPSMRETVRAQVKRKISEKTDYSSEASLREALYALVVVNNTENAKKEELTNQKIIEYNFCMSIKGEHESVRQVQAEKYTKNQIMQENIKTAVKMYADTEYQSGMTTGKMVEYSLKSASCADDLRQCMEEKGASPTPKVNDSQGGYPYDPRNQGMPLNLQGPNGSIGM
jgi:hypothetical protein